MIKRIFVISLLAGLAAATPAKTERELAAHKKITGVYRVYGGSLGDPVAPSVKDAKIMVSVEGTMAKEMFHAIGPDVRDVCTEGTGPRVPRKPIKTSTASDRAQANTRAILVLPGRPAGGNRSEAEHCLCFVVTACSA